jgi:hypothetical protein
MSRLFHKGARFPIDRCPYRSRNKMTNFLKSNWTGFQSIAVPTEVGTATIKH